ncbi:MAG: cation:proton antiporter [Steroidobacteraceae bacterium]
MLRGRSVPSVALHDETRVTKSYCPQPARGPRRSRLHAHWDAAAVSVLLRVSRIAVPSQVLAALEVESGLNDPMSVLLTLVLIGVMTGGNHSSPGSFALLFLEEMGGGAAIGLASGFAVLKTLRWLEPASSVRPLLALGDRARVGDWLALSAAFS